MSESDRERIKELEAELKKVKGHTANPDEMQAAVSRALAEREERARLLRNPRELLVRGRAAVADVVREQTRQKRIARGANPADA